MTALPLKRRRIEDTVKDAVQGIGCISVALLAIDHYDRIAKEYPEPVCKAVLEQIRQLLRATCRENDLPASYTGEKFAVLFGEANSEAACAAAQRLRRRVEGFDWNSIARGLMITVSVGIANTNEAADPTALFALADKRLKLAKVGGNNKVVAG